MIPGADPWSPLRGPPRFLAFLLSFSPADPWSLLRAPSRFFCHSSFEERLDVEDKLSPLPELPSYILDSSLPDSDPLYQPLGGTTEVVLERCSGSDRSSCNGGGETVRLCVYLIIGPSRWLSGPVVCQGNLTCTKLVPRWDPRYKVQLSKYHYALTCSKLQHHVNGTHDRIDNKES